MFDPNKSFFDNYNSGLGRTPSPESSDYTEESIETQDETQQNINPAVRISREAILDFASSAMPNVENRPFSTQIDIDAYEKYGVHVGPDNNNINELDKQRARSQSNLEKAYNALLQGVVDIGAIGAAQGFADLFDVFNGNIFRSDNNFQNPVSRYLEELGEEFRNNHPIYVEDPDKTILNGGLADFGWYARNFPSIFSFLSFMIPSSITTNVVFKGINGISKLTKTGKAVNGTEKLLQSTRAAKGVEKAVEANRVATADKALNMGARMTPGRAEEIKQNIKLGVNSVLGTYMANYTFARDIYNENYANVKAQLADMQQNNPEEFLDFLKRNREISGYDENDETGENLRSIDSMAKDIAHNAAMTDFYWNILTAYPMFSQMYSTIGVWKGMKSIAPTAGLNILNRTAAQNIGKSATEIAEQLASRSFKRKLADTAKNTSFRLGSMGRGSFDAALGNAINVIAQKEGERRAQTDIASSDADFKFDLGKTFSYFADGNLWDAAVWGALGGVFSNVATHTAMRLAGRALGKEFLVDEKVREDEINNRTNLFQVYSTLANKIKEGKNILDPQRDSKGNILTDENGDVIYNPIQSSADRSLAINTLFDHFIQNTAIDAANVGNLDLLKEYLGDKNVIDALVKSGLVNQSDAENVTARVNRIIDEMESSYNRHVAALDRLGIDPYINRIISTENVRKEFDVKDIDREINTIRSLVEEEKSRLASSDMSRTNIDESINRLKAYEYMTRLREYRDRLNFIKNKKGIDYEVERTQLTKAINTIENYIDTLGFDENTRIYIGYRSRLVFDRDEEGNVIVTGKEGSNNIYKTLTVDADEYLKEVTKDKSESEVEGIKVNINKNKNEFIDESIGLNIKSEALRSLTKELYRRELDREILKSQINTTDEDVNIRAAQVERFVNEEALARITVAKAVIKDLMNRKDPNAIYNYINKSLTSEDMVTLNDLSEEDIRKLDEAILVLGVNDSRFNEVINEIYQLKDNLKVQQIKDTTETNEAAEKVKHWQDKQYKEITPVEYNVASDKTAKKVKDAKKEVKVGDTVVYNDPDSGISVRGEITKIEQIKGITKKARPAQKYQRRVYGKTIKTLDNNKVYDLARKEKRIYTTSQIEEKVREARKAKPSLTDKEAKAIRESLRNKPNYTEEELKNDRFMKEIPDTSGVKYKTIKDSATGTEQLVLDDEYNIANGIYTIVEETLPELPERSTPGYTLFTIKDTDTGDIIQVQDSDITHKITKPVAKKVTETRSKKVAVNKDDIKVNDEVTFEQDGETIIGKVKAIGTDAVKVTTSKGDKQVPIDLLKSIVRDSSTGGSEKGKAELTGNKETGGLIREGDKVNIVVANKIINQGIVVDIDEDDITVNVNGKNEIHDISEVARVDGKISSGVNDELGQTSSFNLEKTADAVSSISKLVSEITDEGDGELNQKLISGTLTEEDINKIKEEARNRFDEFAQANELDATNTDNIKVWNEIVDTQVSRIVDDFKNIGALNNDPETTKLSTVRELALLDDFNLGDSNLFVNVANKLVKEYIDYRGIKKNGSKIIVDALDLLRYMYEQGSNINDIAKMFGSIRKYMFDSEKNMSDVYIQMDNVTDKNSKELYDYVVKSKEELRQNNLSPYQTLRLDILYDSMYSMDDADAKALSDKINAIRPGDKLSMNHDVTNKRIIFSVNGTELGALPIPSLNKVGKYRVVNEGWITDVYFDKGFNRSDFIDTVESWFSNYGNKHELLWNLIYYWSYNTTAKSRTENNTVIVYDNKIYNPDTASAEVLEKGNLIKAVDLLADTEEFKSAEERGFVAEPEEGSSKSKRNVSMLNHLRKLFVYSNSPDTYQLLDWVDKLKASYDLMNAVGNDINSYEVTVVGVNEGKLYWSDKPSDRGVPSERIAGFKENPSDFRVGVSSVDTIIDISGEPIPETFASSKKGRTYVALPYKGSGIRHYVHAYPVNVNREGIIGNEAAAIVNEIKEELKSLIEEKLTSPSDDTFTAIRDFLTAIFYNKRNVGPDNTGFSLFRLTRGDESNSGNELTVTADNNRIVLSAGNGRWLQIYNIAEGKTGSKYHSRVIELNDKKISSADIEQLTTEINRLFENISFDININFVKNDMARDKRFGNSIVSKNSNGEFVVTVPNRAPHVFKDYNSFLLEQNLVEVTTKIQPNGTNFIKDSDLLTERPQIKISIDRVKTARREDSSNNVLTGEEIADNFVKNPSKPIKGIDIAKKLIPGLNNFEGKLNIFPSRVIYDENAKGFNAKINFGGGKQVTVTASPEFLALLRTASTPEQTNRNYNRAARLLIHEQLHYLLSQKSNKANVQKIRDVYNEFKSAIEDVTNKKVFDDIATRYGFTDSIAAARDFLFEDANHTDENSRLEEFLIESLTNSRLAEYLNNIEAKDTGTKGNKVSLWQKLMNYLLDLMGINIKENSLYEKEFNILNSSFSQEKATFVEETNNTEVKANEEAPVEDNAGDDFNSLFAEEETLFSTAVEFNNESKALNIDELINRFSPNVKNFVEKAIDDGHINFLCRL